MNLLSIHRQAFAILLSAALIALFSSIIAAQSIGSAGTINGTVTDPNGAFIVGATVTLQNARTGFQRTATTNDAGAFRFDNVPPNVYQLRVTANGFQTATQNITVQTNVPITVPPISLKIIGVSNETVTVTDTSNALETEPTAHTDIGDAQIRFQPFESPGAGLNDVLKNSAPGIVAGENGFIHPLGDHAQANYSIDNQPITDQQSKAFSTQLPVNAIQAVEVITGATPAEYGDKTSLVINAITRSGLNQMKPTGSFSTGYGTFGTTQTEGTLGYGNARYGDFIAFNFERSGRFLDAPEFAVLHDRGTATSVFNHFDYQPNAANTFHVNLTLARNNFQIPNTFEQQALGQDQRQRVKTINVAPGYAHIFNPRTVLTVNPFFRLDQVRYFPSPNPFQDQTTTLSQQRRLLNAGLRTDLAYVNGRHNAKAGVQFQHTFLTEAFQFGITDPNFNPVCLDLNGNSVPGTVCDPNKTTPNPNFLPGLLPYDLTRGGRLFLFNGHTDIKQEAAFVQDNITFGDLTAQLGVRFDNYNGIVHDRAVQPRVGLSYLFKPTKTVMRASYTRNFETPYNENLIFSSATGENGFANGILGDVTAQPLRPGRRNQFNVGAQQGLGKYVIADVDYFYKRTRNAYDFNAILNTPIFFPISWAKSKIDGVSARVTLSNYKGLTASFVAGHTRARFFPPETGGLFFNSNLPEGVFRIDHDQAFEQTTQIQYDLSALPSLRRFAPFIFFSWRYDSGAVAGAVPDYATALTFSADQQQQIGLFCGSQVATLNAPITACSSPVRGALRVRIPADGTANDDTNPPRIAPRHLFDLSFGADNVLRTDRVKMTARVNIINLTNRVALYNFLSTFSGTHFVTPRTVQGQIGITF
jgi:hypothetical protein